MSNKTTVPKATADTTGADTTGVETAAAAQPLADAVATGPHIATEHDFGPRYTTRINLRKPIQRASAEMQPVATLYLREPTAGVLRGIKLINLAHLDAQELLQLLPRIAMPRLSPQETDALSLPDTLALCEAFGGFL
ncbi:phage tail assembly protein [Ottowia sp.]|uniref:phage tail assembly protein n=1 Tax=Ottowia sp. TaxID=1898956 RepID=UPI003A89C9D1